MTPRKANVIRPFYHSIALKGCYDTQHNDIQHKYTRRDNKIMHRVSLFIVILSVILPSVVVQYYDTQLTSNGCHYAEFHHAEYGILKILCWLSWSF